MNREPTSPDLTIGERIELSRRRARFTQVQLADAYEVSTDTVRRWEADELRKGAPVPAVGKLAVHELCWLARRRRRVTLRELSKATGLAVTWLHRAERGEIPPERAGALVAYWRKAGALREVLT